MCNDLRGQTEKGVEDLIMIQYLLVTKKTQAEFQTATEADDTVRELKATIRKGWPPTKEDIPVCIKTTSPSEMSQLFKMVLFSRERD